MKVTFKQIYDVKVEEMMTFLLMFSIFISFCDFFTFTSKVFLLPLVLVAIKFLLDNSKRLVVRIDILSYVILLFTFIVVLLFYKTSFNGLLFVPLIVYMLYFILNKFIDLKLVLDNVLKFTIIFLILFSLIEVAVKVNLFHFPIYEDFIQNYGDKRLDVLRTRVLWGSSLSSAAIGIFFSFYFTLVKKNYLFLAFTFFYIVLTGSRTAIVLCLFCIFVYCIQNRMFWRGIIRKRTLLSLTMLSLIGITIGSILFDSVVSKIVKRAFTIKLDNSFTGRADTTMDVFHRLIADLPDTLFWGVQGDWISDSAFMSIAAQSGILLMLTFVLYIYFLLYKSSLNSIKKLAFIILSILGGMTIGDFYIPAASFLYIITFSIYSKNENHINYNRT